MIEIKMPRLSDTMEEGAVSTWRKHPGDTVAVGDVLVEIETDKAVMEYEAYQAGTLATILVPEGENAEIGAPIALLDDGSGPPAATAMPQEPSSERARPTQDTPAELPAAGAPAGLNGTANGANGTANGVDRANGANGTANTANCKPSTANGAARQIASPLVRKLARENHLDLSRVVGSGPGGRIIRADISGLLANGAPAASAVTAGSAATGESPATGDSAVAADAPVSATPAAKAPPSAPVPVPATAPPPVPAPPSVLATEPQPVPASPGAARITPVRSAAEDEARGSREVPVSQVRRVIARRLAASAREIPHFYVTAVADAQALMDLRATLNEQLTTAGRAKVSVNDLLIRACALALRANPGVNVSYGGDGSGVMLVHDRVNIGVAVAADSGLIVPVITDADTKTVTQLGAEAKNLITLAGERKLTPAQTSGGTFTISNLGMFGVEHFTAIINPPESAILAVGATTREPAVVGDAVLPRYRLRYTLSVDHRVIDGALAAKFLQALTQLIESPWMIIA